MRTGGQLYFVVFTQSSVKPSFIKLYILSPLKIQNGTSFRKIISVQMKCTSTFCGKIDAENVLSMVNVTPSNHCVLMFTEHLPRRTPRIHEVFLFLSFFSRMKPDVPSLCPSELANSFGSCSALTIIVKVKAKFLQHYTATGRTKIILFQFANYFKIW